jgi:glycosidase
MKGHGYDVSAHCEVHPALGDMQTFDAVVREAHALG